jgi:hypothetical protein
MQHLLHGSKYCSSVRGQPLNSNIAKLDDLGNELFLLDGVGGKVYLSQYSLNEEY